MSPVATGSIAYLGPEGTYSEEAAVKYAEKIGGDWTLVPFPTIQAVALAVASGIADEGVAPIENSLEGSVTATLDILIQDSRLSIRNELVIPIDHTLLVVPGTRAADIQTIFSHPQALGQCRAYLEQCFPNAQKIASLSTVSAIDDVWASPVPAAAISPQRAAELRNMETLARGIQDNSSNETRFVALAREDHEATGHDKTSICFSFCGGQAWDALQRSRGVRHTEHQPGQNRVEAHQRVAGTLLVPGGLRRPQGRPEGPGSIGLHQKPDGHAEGVRLLSAPHVTDVD